MEQDQDQKSNLLSCVLHPQGLYKFKCPALNKYGTPACNAEWEYTEVRRLAALTPEEMLKFERMMENRAAKKFCNYKAVSGLIMCPEKEKT